MKARASRLAVAVFVAVSAAIGCTDHLAPSGNRIVRAPRATLDEVADPFFFAWSFSFRDGLIPTQMTGGADAGHLNANWYRQYIGWVTADSSVLAFASSNPGKLYFLGDEVDNNVWTDDNKVEHCITPSQYAIGYHNVVDSILAKDPTARFSPGGLVLDSNGNCRLDPSTPHGTAYAQAFLDAYYSTYSELPPVAEWRFHDFGGGLAGGFSLSGWWSRVQNAAGWSVGNPAANHIHANMVLGGWNFDAVAADPDLVSQDIYAAKSLLLNDGRINQAVWWMYDAFNTSTFLYDANGQALTTFGRVYAGLPVPPSVYISGPSQVAPSSGCNWQAVISGGIAPYTISWNVGGASEWLFDYGSESPFTLTVTVYSADGSSNSASMSVSLFDDGTRSGACGS